jgi:lysozyme family protein
MTIDDLLNDVVAIEGGYSDNPNDSGGPTKFGITQFTARAFGYTGDMQDLTRAQAIDIYKLKYWEQSKLSIIATYSWAVAAEMFDTGVNMGVSVAVKFLQRALNAFNLRGALWPDMVEDGAIGNVTIAAFRSFMRQRGIPGERVMVAALNAQQGARYLEIIENDPKDEDFVYGWFANRVATK